MKIGNGVRLRGDQKVARLSTPAPAAAPTRGAVEPRDVATLSQLQQQGMPLYHRRRFWIPLVMKRRYELTPQEFAQQLTRGSKRLEIACPTPQPVRGTEDVETLRALYLDAPTSSTLMQNLSVLRHQSYSFYCDQGDVGAYGAYQRLRSELPIDTGRAGQITDTLKTPEDVARIRYFKVDAVPNGLSHVVEAATLKDLAARGQRLFDADNQPLTPDHAHRALFQTSELRQVQVGVERLPLAAIPAHQLQDAASTATTVEAALKQYGHLQSLNIPVTPQIWKALQAPLGQATFEERAAWMQSLCQAEGSRRYQAGPAYEFLRANLRPTDSFAAALADYLPLRRGMPAFHGEGAQEAFLRLRDHLDEDLPGPQTAADKRQQYLQLLDQFHDHQAVRNAWTAIAGVDPLAERVGSVVELCHLEPGSTSHALAAYQGILPLRRAGESLHDLVAAYADIRRCHPQRDHAGPLTAFRFVRQDIDTTDKYKLIVSLHRELRNADLSIDTWRMLGANGQHLAERVPVFLRLLQGEDGNAANAAENYSLVSGDLRAGESIETAVDQFAHLRGMVGPRRSQDARQAFSFERHDLTASLPGPWSDQERQRMFESLLGRTRIAEHALSAWRHLSGVSEEHPQPQPPANFPQLIEGLVSLYDTENQHAPNALVALDAVRELFPTDIPGGVREYQRLRPTVQRNNLGQGVELFKFVQSLTPQQRTPFMKLQQVSHNFPLTRELWTELQLEPARVAERVNVLEGFLRKEGGQVPLAKAQLQAVESRLRAGETVPQAVETFSRLRENFGPREGYDAITAFTFMGEKVTPADEPQFVSLANKCRRALWSTQIWEALQQAGSEAGFRQRYDGLMAEPLDRWQTMVGSLQQVATNIPHGVDRDRAAAALFSIGGIRGEPMRAVVQRLREDPVADGTDRLERLCRLMHGADSEEVFSLAWGQVRNSRAGASLEDRLDSMAALLEATHSSAPRRLLQPISDGARCALAVMRRLDSVPATEYREAVTQSLALMTALRRKPQEGQRALEMILDARAQGWLGQRPLGQVLADFATHYAASGSVEKSMHRMEQEALGHDLKVEDRDGELLIGGLRVPRKISTE